MTASLHIQDIAASIAALSVTGVVIKDLHSIPDEVTITNLNGSAILYPNPVNYVSGLTVTRAAYSGRMDVNYTLNYILATAPVGSTLHLAENIDTLAGRYVDILAALINADMTYVQDHTVRGGGAFGPVTSPTGTLLFGSDIQIDILEFYDS